MELINATGLRAEYVMGMKPDGRELLVVVVKGTFLIPSDGGDAPAAEKHAPLLAADLFMEKPGGSAPGQECDYAPFKAKCDILMNAIAYAPGGKPTDRVTVSLRVGAWKKSFDVVGTRRWKDGKASDPEPFTIKLITYEYAFGGAGFAANPVGIGFPADPACLPNTEERNQPVTKPGGSHRPMSFGPVGRNWEPRSKLSGTYDQHWLDQVCPFLPADFDERYYQAAPEDQQIDFPQGGEEVELINLTPQGRTTFRLPKRDIPVVVLRKDGERIDTQARLDTILLLPAAGGMNLTWRASVPLKRNFLEIERVAVGKLSPGWYRALELGKAYAPSLRQAWGRKPVPIQEEVRP